MLRGNFKNWVKVNARSPDRSSSELLLSRRLLFFWWRWRVCCCSLNLNILCWCHDAKYRQHHHHSDIYSNRDLNSEDTLTSSGWSQRPKVRLRFAVWQLVLSSRWRLSGRMFITKQKEYSHKFYKNILNRVTVPPVTFFLAFQSRIIVRFAVMTSSHYRQP